MACRALRLRTQHQAQNLGGIRSGLGGISVFLNAYHRRRRHLDLPMARQFNAWKQYEPSEPAAIIFVVAFGLLLVAHVFQAARAKVMWEFTVVHDAQTCSGMVYMASYSFDGHRVNWIRAEVCMFFSRNWPSLTTVVESGVSKVRTAHLFFLGADF